MRRRFNAVLDSGRLHLNTLSDRFAVGQSLTVRSDLSRTVLTLETENPAAHTSRLLLKSSTAGPCIITGPGGTVATLSLQANTEVGVDLPVPAGTSTISYTLQR